MTKSTRRGFGEDDPIMFSDEALAILKTAQEEVQWLLDRGYRPGTVIDFTGDHHQLAIRQRN